MPDSTHKYTNKLADSSSPYLKQHAHNPVDWMTWCDEAFEKAREEQKLIFVSIGYSACHWCHVMEHQTFEDEQAAEYINEHFISIKVDREERPDVDAVYMHAVQIMTGRGGWPLNCIALPDGRPIFGGTYFPKKTFLERLESIVALNSSNPEKIEEYASNLSRGVAQSDLIIAPPDSEAADFAGGPWPKSQCNKSGASLDKQLDNWRKSWDRKMGLNKGAPKFPLPTNLDFLLHYGTVRGDDDALAQARLTLDAMARGGIYDQIGGGFARYSTDSDWKVPHFEKMLYDNAQLLETYSHAYQIFKDTTYKDVVFETIDFLQRELNDESGGFHSALDADSEGEEGKYYVWTKEELAEILTNEEFKFALKVYDIDHKSHWEHGNNVLMKWESDEVLASDLRLPIAEFRNELKEINSKLYDHRSARIRPGLDNKVLTSWTALTVSGLCASYRAFGDEKHLDRATEALDFLIEKARMEDGGLHHTYHRETGHSIAGFMEDYAFTIKACIDMYEATFDAKHLYQAQDLLNYSFDKFYDGHTGTFWFTSQDESALFAKKQENDDSVIPASNSTMATNLFKLGKYFSRLDWIERSDRMLLASWAESLNIRRATNWGKCLLMRSAPFYEIVIAATDESEIHNARSDFDDIYLAQTLFTSATPSDNFPKWIEGKSPIKNGENSIQIFVCQEGACQLPVEKVNEAVNQLNLKK
jgi:hypothetical protein